MQEEFKNEPEDLWGNPIQDGKSWQPCADQRTPGHFCEFSLPCSSSREMDPSMEHLKDSTQNSPVCKVLFEDSKERMCPPFVEFVL
jgi:hypothetical protein